MPVPTSRFRLADDYLHQLASARKGLDQGLRALRDAEKATRDAQARAHTRMAKTEAILMAHNE